MPYDRTLLSKVLPTGDPTKTLLRPQEFLDQYNIDIKLASKAEKVDTKNKTITLGNGEKIVSSTPLLTLHYSHMISCA